MSTTPSNDTGRAAGAAAGATTSSDTAPSSGASTVSYRPLTSEDLPLVEPLWRSLLTHLDELDSVVPLVPADTSWPLRLAAYRELLADGRSFAVGAWRDERLIGYAMVHIGDPDPVWATGATFVELTTLSVAPAERRAGVGALLLDAVERELTTRGIDEYVIGVDSVNDGARRFYERRGFRIGYHLMHGRVGTTRATDAGPGAARDDETPETALHGEA